MTINPNPTVRVLPWHAGLNLRDLPAPEAESRARAHIPWTTEPRPAYQLLDDDTIRATDTRGITIVHPDPAHPDHQHVLRHTRSRIEDFQPEDLFDLAALLVTKRGWRWEAVLAPVEHGQIQVVLAPAVFPAGVDGDTPLYCVITKDYRSVRSISGAIIPIRDACVNMHHLPRCGMGDLWRLPSLHNDVGRKVGMDRSVKGALITGSRLTAAMTKLAAAPFYPTQFDRLCEILLKGEQSSSRTKQKHHAGILETLLTSPTIPDHHRKTRYGTFCAVTEWMDWTRAGMREGDRMLRLAHPLQVGLRIKAFRLLSQGL